MSKEINRLKKNHIKLIEKSGGIVENNTYVVKPGILITKISNVTDEAQKLFEDMNIDTSLTKPEQHSEFNSRITYMSFKDKKESSSKYNDDMINKFQHLSVYNDEFITFLVSGVSVEAELEFVAHTEATVARLTSSKTAAQNDPLYKISTFKLKERTEEDKNKIIQLQKDMIREDIKKRNDIIEKYGEEFIFKNLENREIFNTLTKGNKVTSFTITMSLKNWHKTLIGRLSEHGVELEMLEVMEDIAKILHNKYPQVIQTVKEYYEMGNGKKYE